MAFLPRLMAVLLVTVTIASENTVEAQFESRFGTDFPELRECLEFSQKTGTWRHNGRFVTPEQLIFHSDGSFEFISQITFLNKFKKEYAEVRRYSGNWELEHRPFLAAERKIFNVPADVKNKGYFLTIEFNEYDVSNEPPGVADEGIVFREMSVSGKTIFVLDEEGRWKERGKKGVQSNPTALNWLVVSNSFKFVAKDGKEVKSQWTQLPESGSRKDCFQITRD